MSDNLCVDGDERYVYLINPKINYEELGEHRTFIHLVENEDSVGIILTVASNSMYAAMKVANAGHKLITSTTLLEVFEKMAMEEAEGMLDIEEGGI
jgi:hypothetical protein